MAQGINKKLLDKKVRKGHKGFPVMTVAFYGKDNKTASKLVCATIPYQGAEPEIIKKWFSETDIRHSESILKQVLNFMDENGVKTVAMAEGIFGCPHEEGVDYPVGEPCPECVYWQEH